MSYQTLTGACFGTGWKPTPVPMGGDSSFLWNRQQYCGNPYNATLDLQNELDMSARLAEQYGKDRLYRHDWIKDPCFGKQFSCAMPPFVPQPTQQPSDMSLADMPVGHVAADDIYKEKLFVQPHFLETPIITNQQLFGNFSVNTLVQ